MDPTMEMFWNMFGGRQSISLLDNNLQDKSVICL